MKREELLATARQHMWAAWQLSSEELASQAADTLFGLGMLVPEGGARQLEQAQARVTELEDQRDRRRIRLVTAEADLLKVRGLLSPAGEQRRIPSEVEIHERVAPAVEWLLNRVAELEAERHTTNEALSEAAEALREQRDRIAVLERPALERHRREVRERYRWLADDARQRDDIEGERAVLQQLADREALWTQEDALAAGFAADPLVVKPWEPGPSSEASAARLTRLFAPAPLEDPHDSPLHHGYRLGRDLPQTGGA